MKHQRHHVLNKRAPILLNIVVLLGGGVGGGGGGHDHSPTMHVHGRHTHGIHPSMIHLDQCLLCVAGTDQ
ncbi:hypothetical protein BCR42DRAFT_426229 [Absidia repens]|uniref:Uncharacterized protein n=1 Tax=Absidia repens TaxID=90262 RepID=A0A1X2I1K1_9FUNG|nr:hypothetical protein BCR42DRAFT_426229 [Absidia repens]